MSSARKGEQPPGLPWRCHVVLPGLPAGANVAVCERGTNGVRMTSIDLGAFQAMGAGLNLSSFSRSERAYSS